MLLVVPLLLSACNEDDLDDDSAGEAEETVRITSEALPDAQLLLPYEAALESDGAIGDVEWTWIGGGLPPGLELDSQGTVSGDPLEQGEFEFEVLAEDGVGTDQATVTITVPPVVLMSGFEPFGGYPTNPSIESLWPLDEQLVVGLDLRVVELPVVWDLSWSLLEEEIERLRPAVVIGTGMAGDEAMQYETHAVNEEWGTDNDGQYAAGEPVVEGGPESLGTDLPVDEMRSAVEAVGYDTVTSSNAGTYLCNHIFYNIAHYAEYEADWPLLGGFVHVPPAPYGPVFTVEDVTEAHQVGLEALAYWMEGDRAMSEPAIDSNAAPVYLGILD